MNNEPIHVSATYDTNFVHILRCYKSMKINKQIQLIVLLLVNMIPFSYGLGFLVLLLTITVCVGTMIYLIAQQEDIISEMQKSLYQICLKSITEQTDRPADVDQNQD